MRPFRGAVVLALLAACTSGVSDGEPSTVLTAEYGSTAEALCRSLRAISGGDPITGRAIFIDDVHESLHVLARTLEAIDRPSAARLLEAKQRVEADLATLSVASEVDLGQLIARVAEAATVLRVPTPTPCNAQGPIT